MTKAKGGEREAHSCVSVIRFPDKTGNKKNLDSEKIGLHFRDKVVIVLISKHANDHVLLFFSSSPKAGVNKHMTFDLSAEERIVSRSKNVKPQSDPGS